MKKVLVLCTGNSCRSLMAEALINYEMADKWQAYSAGVLPSHPNPRAVQLLQEDGIDTSYLRSKSVEEFLHRDDLDLVITVCDHARQTCPLFHKPVPQIHIGIEDPVIYTLASEETAMAAFRKCFESIKTLIMPRLKELD